MHPSVSQQPHVRRGCGGQLIEPVEAPENQASYSTSRQHPCHDGSDVVVGHPQCHRLGTGWIGQGPEEVERGLNGQLLPHSRDVLHRGMVKLREQEGDTHLRQDSGMPCRFQHDVHAERLQGVGGAGLRRCRP